MKSRFLKFIPLIFYFFPLLLIGNLIPIPSAHAKAVIRSCANPPAPPSRPTPYKAGSGKGGGPAGILLSSPPFSAPETQPSLPSLQSPPYVAENQSAPFTKQKENKNSLDLHRAGKKVDRSVRRADEFYLSNDDSMSLASAQRLIYSIRNFIPIYRDEIRPHEFLNYYHFKTLPLSGGESFSVDFQMAPRDQGQSLALAVQGRKSDKNSRRNAVLTLLIDKSGSMSAEGKMEFLKEGLKNLKEGLKAGDILNIVEFDHEVCTAVEGYAVGSDPWADYDKTVQELEPRGSTDLHAGLVEAYNLAERFYQRGKINRVLLITDAMVNRGSLSPELMASIGKYYDSKKIGLSGIGVGLDFNDELLDELTEQGKGAYLFLGIRDAIPRVFNENFVSLLETVARDVHFKLKLPKDLHLQTFYGEEVSTDKSKVQAIHYFANTSQLFFLDLKGQVKEANPSFDLQIEYEDPLSGDKKTQNFSKTLSEIEKNNHDNIAKARLIMSFADLLEKTALPGSKTYGGWAPKDAPIAKNKKAGKELCEKHLQEMKELEKSYQDGETQEVISLAEKYCARF